MARGYRSLRATFENDGVIGEAGGETLPQEAIINDVELAENTAAMEEEAADIAAMSEGVVEIDSAASEVEENVAPMVDEAAAGEGMSPETATAVEAYLTSICKRVGIKRRNRFSKESFGNRNTRKQATVYAKESVTDTIKEMWTKFVNWLKRIWEGIKSWFGKLNMSADSLKEAFKTLRTSIEDDKRSLRFPGGMIKGDSTTIKLMIGADVTSMTYKDITSKLDLLAKSDAVVILRDSLTMTAVMTDSSHGTTPGSGGAIHNNSAPGGHPSYIANIDKIAKGLSKLVTGVEENNSNLSKVTDYRVQNDWDLVHVSGCLPGGKVLIIESKTGKTEEPETSDVRVSLKGLIAREPDIKDIGSLPELTAVCDDAISQLGIIGKHGEKFNALLKQAEVALSAATASINAASTNEDKGAQTNLRIARKQFATWNSLATSYIDIYGSSALTCYHALRTCITRTWKNLDAQ